MEITKTQYEQWLKEQVGQTCQKHGTKIRMGRYGLFCGQKDFRGWCTGNPYPRPENESLTIKP